MPEALMVLPVPIPLDRHHHRKPSLSVSPPYAQRFAKTTPSATHHTPTHAHATSTPKTGVSPREEQVCSSQSTSPPKTPTQPSYPSPISMSIPTVPLTDAPAPAPTSTAAPAPSPARRIPPPLAPPSRPSPSTASASSSRYPIPPSLPRRESFHFQGDRPHPPPLRTTHSSIGPMTTTTTLMVPPAPGAEGQGEWDKERVEKERYEKQRGRQVNDDREELTTKGRKRKRLAKACSACHKNKRRCDGFAPCSNCEFSNRPCQYLNAQGETIPPPRTRDSSTNAPGKDREDGKTGRSESATSGGGGGHERRTSAESNWSRRESMVDGDTEMCRRPSMGPLQLVEMDASLGAELVDIFLKRCMPLATMLHPPTFHYRLYLNQVSPLLLDIMYALAARLCENPLFLSTFPPSHPPWQRGELFALRAHRAAESLLDQRRGWNDDARRADQGTWHETELAQACYLLSVYFTSLREAKLGAFYLDAGLEIIRPASQGFIPPPAGHPGLTAVEYATHGESRNRTFWALVMHDLCAAANGRPRRLSEGELGAVPLPGSESLWVRWGGGAAGGEPGRRDGLIPGTGNWIGEEGMVGEMGNVIRILSIFADIMSLATDPHTGDSKTILALRLEAALKSWAAALPRHLHFNEPNLSSSVAKLASPVAEIKTTGFLYAYMHAIAECGMFYLQAAVAPQQSDVEGTAHRQRQAVQNLMVIMDTIGQAGREGPCFIFPLFVITNWQEHLKKSNLIVPDAKYHHDEERLALWWNEMAREWGCDRHEILMRGFYSMPSNQATVPSPPLRYTQPTYMEPPPPPSGSSSLGLYQTSPGSRPSMESATALSPTSTMSITTPNFSGSSYSRFSLPNLPPLRPRATSGASVMSMYQGRSPSPRLLPSMSSGMSDRGERERDRSHSREPISLPPLGPEYKYRDPPSPGPRHPLSHSLRYTPKHHPYVREKPLPPPQQQQGQGQGQGQQQRSPRMSWGGEREGLMGIAALVRAAEKETEKESEERNAAAAA
ncbi:hypothetical protein IAT38_003309 [Cryptococcus sp. DSM 104549]